MNTFSRIALAAMGASMLLAGAAPAAAKQVHCYDFSGLAPDSRYTVGDAVDARHATITFRQYFTNGNPSTNDARHAKVVRSKIAGGASPEMGLYLIGVNIQPKEPVSRMRLNVAQSISQTGGFANANLEVNGERIELPTGFAGANGRTLGRAPHGRATVTAQMAPHAGNWHAGTIEIVAEKGHIGSVTFGGHTWHMDNVCLERASAAN
jgi:hypothetical protein